MDAASRKLKALRADSSTYGVIRGARRGARATGGRRPAVSWSRAAARRRAPERCGSRHAPPSAPSLLGIVAALAAGEGLVRLAARWSPAVRDLAVPRDGARAAGLRLPGGVPRVTAHAGRPPPQLVQLLEQRARAERRGVRGPEAGRAVPHPGARGLVHVRPRPLPAYRHDPPGSAPARGLPGQGPRRPQLRHRRDRGPRLPDHRDARAQRRTTPISSWSTSTPGTTRRTCTGTSTNGRGPDEFSAPRVCGRSGGTRSGSGEGSTTSTPSGPRRRESAPRG